MIDQFINDFRIALVETSAAKVTTAMGKEVDFGSEAHVKDLEASIRDLERYRNATRRGTSKRQDYSRAISRMRGQLKAARRRGIKMGWLKEGALIEGGLGGHLMHLYDNWDLTFGELKEILRAAAAGELEEVSEKLDGQNLFITWDISEGKLKAARNQGNIKSGGLDAEGIASKFAGRGSVHDAFVNGFKIISKAIDSLSPAEKAEIFGQSGNVWYSVEIMFVDNPNTIVYDKNNVVFHKAGSAEFDSETGKPTGKDIGTQFDALVARIDTMQAAIADETWNLARPAILQLKKLESDQFLHSAISKIDAATSKYGIVDSDSIGLYLKTRVHIELIAPLKLNHKQADELARRIMGEKGAPTVAQIAKNVSDSAQKNEIKGIVKTGVDFMKAAIEPIEMAIHDFAVEVLRGLESTFIIDNSKEIARLRGQVSTAIEAIEASGSEDALAVLAQQMKKLQRVENIAAAMEGIVFRFKGTSYKFTGAFAPANQLLGLFKYGRGKIPPLQVVNTMSNDSNDMRSIGESLDRFFRSRVKLSNMGYKTYTHTGRRGLYEKSEPEPVQLQYNTHIPWPKHVLKIPYGKREGVGPGEDRLAAILDGEVQGGNVSYDIVAAGKKWEVKQPDDSREIRPGTEGMKAIAPLVREIIQLSLELQDGFSNVDSAVIDAAFTANDESVYASIKKFIEEDVPMMIEKGEIPKGRIFGGSRQKGYALVDVLGALSILMTSKKGKDKQRTIVYGDKKHNVDASTYVRIGKALGVPESEMDIDASDVFRAKFTHRAFKNPVAFLKDYTESVTPSSVFGETDGIILVNPAGYTIVPKADMDEMFEFSRISQGKPKFKVKKG